MAGVNSSARPTAHVLRDKPQLLPTNRKLRNLVSISLRNLSLIPTTSSSFARSKTADDDAVPNTLRSPAKLVALREQKTLGHSRSINDLKTDSLRRVAEEDAVEDGDAANGSVTKPSSKLHTNGALRTPPRPSMAKMRRRSTLEWVNATPQRRQEKLENVTAERMADVFFSMHVEGVEEPIYVSETVEQTMNPTFRHIDWSACGPGVMRTGQLTCKFWVKSAKMGRWRCLLEMLVDLQSLQYLGKSIDNYHHPLPPNALLFNLTDGVYTPYVSRTHPPAVSPQRRRTPSPHRRLPTASFDALLRLAKLDDSIQDALQTRSKIAADLEALLSQNNTALSDRDRVAEAEDRLKTIEYARKTVGKQIEKGRKVQAEKLEALRKRRELMAQDLQSRAARTAEMRKEKPELVSWRDEREVKHQVIAHQRQRICADLQRCYPVLPIAFSNNNGGTPQPKHPPPSPAAFAIRGLHLPNSASLDSTPSSTPETISAALGHAAHLIHLLSFYLAQPLPYPVTARSSTSTIYDAVSLLKTTASVTQRYGDEKVLRTYPLFSKGVPRFRFEYGVFLLGKDVQILLESGVCGSGRGVGRRGDVGEVLGNLAVLLAGAGVDGEEEERKRGGDGLLLEVPAGLPLVRKGSEGSLGSALSGVLFPQGKEGEGAAVGSLKRVMGRKGG